MFHDLLCIALSPFLFCNHFDGEERAGCFTLLVFLVSCDCYFSVDFPHCMQCVIVVFPEHTHLLF